MTPLDNENELETKEETEPVKTDEIENLSNLPQVDLPEQPTKAISNITEETKFGEVVDEAKVNILKEASAEDEKFVATLKNELKEAAVKSAQLENDKQELERKNIELYQNYIETKTQLEKHQQNENLWNNKVKRREYHYNGLKDIMLFVHINNPMCIPLMYIIAVLIAPIYLLWTLILCPLGTLIGGTKDQERPKIVKGAIYTILLVALVVAIVFAMYACMHYGFKWF